jgi:predicted ribosome quality control (RQC) complex YloA/Tae2 family protein
MTYKKYGVKISCLAYGSGIGVQAMEVWDHYIYLEKFQDFLKKGYCNIKQNKPQNPITHCYSFADALKMINEMTNLDHTIDIPLAKYNAIKQAEAIFDKFNKDHQNDCKRIAFREYIENKKNELQKAIDQLEKETEEFEKNVGWS